MQVNKIETTKKLKMLDLQMDVLKTSKKKYGITNTEVTELTPDARCVLVGVLWVRFQFSEPVGQLNLIHFE